MYKKSIQPVYIVDQRKPFEVHVRSCMLNKCEGIAGIIYERFFHLLARCADDQVKLIGGYAETVGRVEICSNHRWGALSFTYWTAYYNARTTCIELGFGGI